MKPILCLDFDGVLHSYTSGWQGVDVIPDEPVDGALEFLIDATEYFSVHIYSSRSASVNGREAMEEWLHAWLYEYPFEQVQKVMKKIKWPVDKPPAFVTIDDRTYPPWDGNFPDPKALLNFKPWWKK